MRVEFEQFEQKDLSQPSPDFALNRNLKGFKINRRALVRAAWPVILGVSAVTAGTVQGFGSGKNASPESTPSSPRASLVTDIPTSFPVETPEVSVLAQKKIISNAEINSVDFETLETARTFLESEEGAKWLSGSPVEEVGLFPWNSVETWRIFSDLRTTGNETHFVFLVPHTDNNKFSVIGVENVGSKIILDYIDRDGSPKSISFKGTLDLKDLLGADFEKLFENNITVWPDISYPNGNSDGLCTNRFRKPTPGTTDGFACSIDGIRGHYFQSQNSVPEYFK